MPFVCSIVIPTYNASSTIGEQLSALASQVSDTPFEVVIADNGSTGGLVAAVAPWAGSLPVRIVDASARRGPSAARNIGVQHAVAPYLLFCDADDVVSADWVELLVSALKRHDFVGGPYLTFSGREGIWMPAYDSAKLPTAWDDCVYAYGGNFGVRASVWQQLSGFDEHLTGAEEIEFAWRAREIGVRPVFVPGAHVAYRVRSSLRGRLWHEYNSGRGTAVLGARLGLTSLQRRSQKTQARRYLMLLSRFPRTLRSAPWVAWLATIAFEAGAAASLRHRRVGN